MSDFTVRQYGVNTSGRPVLMTAFMHDWLEHRYDAVGFRPGITQGAFMARLGGGAAASSGAHDLGGCLDFSIRDLTPDQLDAWIWECREHGGAAYRRDQTAKHGDMPPHVHLTLGADYPLSPMAKLLWGSYVNGGDGLGAGPGRPAGAPDYERRPDPLVLTPPPEEDMALTDEDIEKIADAVWAKAIPGLGGEIGVVDPKTKTRTRKALGVVAAIYNRVGGGTK